MKLNGPLPSSPPGKPGGEFDDELGTRGKNDFALTQQFFGSVPGFRDYPVRIVPCIATNQPGDPKPKNVVKATSQQVLINDDPGSTTARTCKNP